MEEEEEVVVGWMSCGANCHLKSFAVDLSWSSLVDASVLLFFYARCRLAGDLGRPKSSNVSHHVRLKHRMVPRNTGWCLNAAFGHMGMKIL